jgi:hypothetical protein
VVDLCNTDDPWPSGAPVGRDDRQPATPACTAPFAAALATGGLPSAAGQGQDGVELDLGSRASAGTGRAGGLSGRRLAGSLKSCPSKRYRSGEQTIRVEHVTVNEGGHLEGIPGSRSATSARSGLLDFRKPADDETQPRFAHLARGGPPARRDANETAAPR